MRHGDELGVQLQPVAERRGERRRRAGRCRRRCGTSSAPPGASPRGELIDQREQRQLLGIGEKEPAQAGRRRRAARRRRGSSSSHCATDRRARSAAIGESQRCSASRYGSHISASAPDNRSQPVAIERLASRGLPSGPLRTAPQPSQNRDSVSPSSPASCRISCCDSSIMSPPASACWLSTKPLRMVQTRPPTRSRASTTVTAAPSAPDRAPPPVRPDRRRRPVPTRRSNLRTWGAFRHATTLVGKLHPRQRKPAFHGSFQGGRMRAEVSKRR